MLLYKLFTSFASGDQVNEENVIYSISEADRLVAMGVDMPLVLTRKGWHKLSSPPSKDFLKDVVHG